MWEAYPMGGADDVKSRIGGKVNYGWIKNTCAIRMSKVLNETEMKIPSGFSGMNVISGGQGNKYAFRIRELLLFIKARLGNPTIVEEGTNGISRNKFFGRQGIIVFHVNFSDATGHITLWNGNKTVNSDDYFHKSNKVELWHIP